MTSRRIIECKSSSAVILGSGISRFKKGCLLNGSTKSHISNFCTGRKNCGAVQGVILIVILLEMLFGLVISDSDISIRRREGGEKLSLSVVSYLSRSGCDLPARMSVQCWGRIGLMVCCCDTFLLSSLMLSCFTDLLQF